MTKFFMTFLTAAVPMFFCSKAFAGAPTDFKLLHYNIRELDSKKIKDKAPQIERVKSVLKHYAYDILSLNEIQYDLPGVPNQKFKTEGQNLEELKSLIGLPKEWNSSFFPANTGMKAKKNSQGEYETNPNSPEARMLADQVNFGTFPAQYSSGALYKFEKSGEKVFSKIKWKEFNPTIDLKKFALANGEALPEDMELFDKNFTDVKLRIQGKAVHLILFHAVPSHHFGNSKSPNYARNRDQLRFLEWYLTGKTDIKPHLSTITPISGESFVAVGDFNADIRDEKSPGAKVLKRLFSQGNLWMPEESLNFTNEDPSFRPDPFRLLLDYIVISKDIVPLSAKIIHPSFERVELGCGEQFLKKEKKGFVLKTYENEKKQTCKVLVRKEYERFKEASDHYPIWGHFQIK